MITDSQPGQVWTKSADRNHGQRRTLLLQSSAKIQENPTLSDLQRNLNFYSSGQDTQEFMSTLELTTRQVEHLEKLLDNTIIQLSLLFPASPCLFWKGAKSRQGYAKHRPPNDLPGSSVVSRYIYTYLHGDPGELEVHHKCGVVGCINPDHLEAIPAEENLRLGNPLQTYCQATWQAAA